MKSENPISKRPRQSRQWPNFHLSKKDVENPIGKSETVQDDSYSIEEILQKFSVGEFQHEVEQPTYQDGASHESIDLRQVASSDLIDRMELLIEVKQKQALLAAKQKQAQLDFEEDEKNQREADQEKQKLADSIAKAKREAKSSKYSDDKGGKPAKTESETDD
ncbi:MAG: hypothetical protein [Microvirus sp.]|nr:MAG: hypothetical protein [Microvirus sp.]